MTFLGNSDVAIATFSVLMCMTTPDLLRKVRRFAPIVAIGLIVFGSICQRAAAIEAVKMSFDVPADFAERSLKKFSAQSGREVLFDSDSVSNITTNAVK